MTKSLEIVTRLPSTNNPGSPAETNLQQPIYQSLSNESTLQQLTRTPGIASDMHSDVHTGYSLFRQDTVNTYPSVPCLEMELDLLSTKKRTLESEKDAFIESYTALALLGEETSSKKYKRKKNYQRHAKPPYTYLAMIALVIQNSPEKKLKLSEIFEDIAILFPCFTGDYKGWKDSIRHNLSCNDCFEMVLKDPRKPYLKGNSWTVDVTKIPLDSMKVQNTASVRAGSARFTRDLAPYILEGLKYSSQDGMDQHQVLQLPPPISSVQGTDFLQDSNMATPSYPFTINSLLSHLPKTSFSGNLPVTDNRLPSTELHFPASGLSGKLPFLDNLFPSTESHFPASGLSGKLPFPDNLLPFTELHFPETDLLEDHCVPEMLLPSTESHLHVTGLSGKFPLLDKLLRSMESNLPMTGLSGKRPVLDNLLTSTESHLHVASLSGKRPVPDNLLPSTESQLLKTNLSGKHSIPDNLLPSTELHLPVTGLSGNLPILDNLLPSMESRLPKTGLSGELPALGNPLPSMKSHLPEACLSGNLSAPYNPVPPKEACPYIDRGFGLMIDTLQSVYPQYGRSLSSLPPNAHSLYPTELQTTSLRPLTPLSHPLNITSTNDHTLNPSKLQIHSLRPHSIPLRPPGSPTFSFSTPINPQAFSTASSSISTIALSSVSNDEKDCKNQQLQTELCRKNAKNIGTDKTPNHVNQATGSSSEPEDVGSVPQNVLPNRSNQQPCELPTSYTKCVPPNVVAPPSRLPFFPFPSVPCYSCSPVSCAGRPYWSLMALPSSPMLPGHPPRLSFDLDSMSRVVPPNKSVYDVWKNHPGDVIHPAVLYQQCLSNTINFSLHNPFPK